MVKLIFPLFFFSADMEIRKKVRFFGDGRENRKTFCNSNVCWSEEEDSNVLFESKKRKACLFYYVSW